MKINRAFGLLFFLFAVQFMLANAFGAFASAATAVFGTVEAAAVLAQERMQTP